MIYKATATQMHTEKNTEMHRTCRACIEKCITASHRPLDWGDSSFFRVMEPNSSSRLVIPSDFVKRMQCGVCKDAILQGPSGHLWHVNLCCVNTQASFTDGWESFVSDHFIEAADIMVFRHVDDVNFSVQVFGPSGCEKQSTFSFQNYASSYLRERNSNYFTICNKRRCEHKQNSTEPPIGEEKISLPHRTLAGSQAADSPKSTLLRKPTEFSVVLHKTAVTVSYRVTIPREFANRWMSKIEEGEQFQVRLKYEQNPKKWSVFVRVHMQRHAKSFGLYYGWRDFAVSNGLHEGDRCVFKLVDEAAYIFEVHVSRHGLHENCGNRQKSKRNVTAHEKMKTSMVNLNRYPLRIYKESIVPGSMVDYRKYSRMRNCMEGSESQNPLDVTCIQGSKGKNKIEVIEID